jgi:hypothetical protein
MIAVAASGCQYNLRFIKVPHNIKFLVYYLYHIKKG